MCSKIYAIGPTDLKGVLFNPHLFPSQGFAEGPAGDLFAVSDLGAIIKISMTEANAEIR